MSWFNETHEGDNPESNATKNLDNTEANGEDVDKKMDDFASDVDSGKAKSSFWDKINPELFMTLDSNWKSRQIIV